jgi:hypothetical protein
MRTMKLLMATKTTHVYFTIKIKRRQMIIKIDLPRELTDNEAHQLENKIAHLLDKFGLSKYVVEVPHVYSECLVCKEQDGKDK